MSTDASEDRSRSGSECRYWTRNDGRSFITGPEDEIVNLARLTAYAEYGSEIYEAEAHHRIPQEKIDAPGFIEPLPKEDHAKLHAKDPDPIEVDGIPMLPGVA